MRKKSILWKILRIVFIFLFIFEIYFLKIILQFGGLCSSIMDFLDLMSVGL